MIEFSILLNLGSDILNFFLNGQKFFVLSSKVKDIWIPLHQLEFDWSYPSQVNTIHAIVVKIVIKYQSDIRNYLWSDF